MKYRLLLLALCVSTSLCGMERSDRADEFPKKLTILSENLDKNTSVFQFVQDREIGNIHKKTVSALKTRQLLLDFTRQITIHQSDDYIDSIAFSPDGNTIATTSFINRFLQLWDHEGVNISKITLDYKPRSMEFSPSGNMIMITSLFGEEIVIYNFDGTVLNRLDHMVDSSVFDPSGEIILTVPQEYNVKLWNLEGKNLACLKHSGKVRSAVFSPEGKTIMTVMEGMGEKEVKSIITMWNLNGEKLSELNHKESLSSVSFSPDGTKILVTLEVDGTAQLLDVEGRELALLQDPSVGGGIAMAKFHPDGNMIGTHANYHKVIFFNFKGDQLAAMDYSRDYVVSRLTFSPDGRQIAVRVGNSSAHIWRAF